MFPHPRNLGRTVVDLTVILSIVTAFYFVRLGDLPLRGEESRRATGALDCLRDGDWLVPREQGQPFLSRPPVGSWLIAAAIKLHGRADEIAARLPSVAAVLLLAFLAYGYARSFLARPPALVAAVAFATMPEILQMGRLAETDIIFTLFLGGAFLTWHWGWSRGWPGWATWGLSYALLAAATLTKGPQAPVCFGLAVGGFLLITRRLAALFSRGHAFGLVVFATLVGAWAVPYYLDQGAYATWRTLAGDSADRFAGWKWRDVLVHWAQYPCEATGCTAPWSILPVALVSHRFRAGLGEARSHALYLTLCLVAGFLPCWLTPGGQTRYLMPVYPCVAVLAGIVFDRVAAEDLAGWVRFVFGGARRILVAEMFGFAAVVAWLTWGNSRAELQFWKQPAWFMAGYLVVAVVAAALQFWHSPFSPSRTRFTGVIAIACILGLTYNGVIVTQLAARGTGAEIAVADLKRQLPPDARLTSLGLVHAKFLYLYGNRVELLDPEAAARVPPGDYFCFNCWSEVRRPLPFPYEELAAVNVDRVWSEHPQLLVIVARRTDDSHKSLQVTQR